MMPQVHRHVKLIKPPLFSSAVNELILYEWDNNTQCIAPSCFYNSLIQEHVILPDVLKDLCFWLYIIFKEVCGTKNMSIHWRLADIKYNNFIVCNYLSKKSENALQYLMHEVILKFVFTRSLIFTNYILIGWLNNQYLTLWYLLIMFSKLENEKKTKFCNKIT